MGYYEDLAEKASENGKFKVIWLTSVSFKNTCPVTEPHLPHRIGGGYSTPSCGRIDYACVGHDLPALGAEVVDLHRGSPLSAAHIMWRGDNAAAIPERASAHGDPFLWA